MVSAFTPNIQLEEPARGDYVGIWDTPVNSNMTVVDLVAGGQTSITLNNSPVVLASAQYQCSVITFSSTLTGSVTVTFPTSFKKPYSVYHTCTGSSAFTITLQTTVAGGEVIALPPGSFSTVLNDGTNLRFMGLERVGSFWDYGGSSVPNWVSGCTKPPYLNCDGSAFSAVTYPALATILGGTTLPDSRGRFRATLNQATNRILSSNGGVDGNTNLAAGGADTVTLGTSNLPPYTPSGTVAVVSADTKVPQNTSVYNGFGGGGFNYGVTGAGGAGGPPTIGTLASSGTLTGTAQGGVSDPVSEMPPTYIGGLTLIRAA